MAVARAIVLQPKYLFCDEPNSGLDPLTSIVIDNLLSELTHEYDMTTVINTHDMNSVFEIGEKVLFIHEGHKEWEGSNRRDHVHEQQGVERIPVLVEVEQDGGRN